MMGPDDLLDALEEANAAPLDGRFRDALAIGRLALIVILVHVAVIALAIWLAGHA